MKALTAFLPWVEPNVLGAPQPLILQAIRDACIEFCERTHVVQTVDTQDVQAGEAEVSVSAPNQQRLVTILRVTYNAYPLDPVAADAVSNGAAMRAGTDTTVESSRGDPRVYYQPTWAPASLMYLWPVPSVAAPGALAVRASFAPTRAATQVEDVLFDEYVEDIAHGALARLYAVPDQVFTNQGQAKQAASAFAAAMSEATSTSRIGGTRGSLRVSGRRFA